METPWEYRYAHRMQKMGSSVIRELLKLTEQPDIISFGGGLPAPEVFPLKEFKNACNYVLDNDGAQALQYGTTEGYRPLREMIARHTVRYSVEVKPLLDEAEAKMAEGALRHLPEVVPATVQPPVELASPADISAAKDDDQA